MSSSDVLVVGGGPAGACTAWSLARAGARVTLVDRARFPRDKPCAEYLSPQASRVLDAMGVLESVESAGGAQLDGMIVRAPSGERFVGEFVAAHGYRGFRDRGLALPRRVLDAILIQRARDAGARVLEGTRVLDVDRDARGRVCGVQLAAESGETRSHRAAMVIGADGLRSVVSRRLGLSRASRWPRRVAFVAHYADVQDIGTHGEMHVDRNGYLGMADVGGGITNVALVVPASRARRSGADRAALLERWIAERPSLASRFTRASRMGDVRATGPFAVHSRRAWTPGAALVGDAAEFFDPFTGEGIYAALRGGEMLAPHVIAALAASSDRASDEALARYDAERHREFAGKWKVEKLVGCAVAFPLLMNHAARVLSRRRDLADLLVGVAGDFVPAKMVLRPSYLLSLLFALPRSLSRA